MLIDLLLTEHGAPEKPVTFTDLQEGVIACMELNEELSSEIVAAHFSKNLSEDGTALEKLKTKAKEFFEKVAELARKAVAYVLEKFNAVKAKVKELLASSETQEVNAPVEGNVKKAVELLGKLESAIKSVGNGDTKKVVADLRSVEKEVSKQIPKLLAKKKQTLSGKDVVRIAAAAEAVIVKVKSLQAEVEKAKGLANGAKDSVELSGAQAKASTVSKALKIGGVIAGIALAVVGAYHADKRFNDGKGIGYVKDKADRTKAYASEKGTTVKNAVSAKVSKARGFFNKKA